MLKKKSMLIIAIIVLVLLTYATFTSLNNKYKNDTSTLDNNILGVSLKEIDNPEIKNTVINKLEELGENDITMENVDVREFSRKNKQFYYIVSPENTMEIRASDNRIVRVNMIVVE